ncbi:putative csep0242 effector protein [Erysiphe neolycopersici]|uniref:Putative csep0242 effector protein n=1 Tax=Erysiphe neolycopersici TaxID=212602 RepID=A0A420I1N8_9PEZI|nr:putative csep0242 effector protein [Erysiphe neolycopersici]
MRLNILTQIMIIFSVIPGGISRPSLGKRADILKILSRRTPYAIIPVDGGASANVGNDSPLSSITPTTFTTIAVAATQTSIETDIVTLPPVTNYITATLTVEGSTITQMTQVTVTTLANPTTITKISYSIIDISSSSQQFSTYSTYSSGATSNSIESLVSPSSSSSWMTVSPTQISKSDPFPYQTTIPSMSSQNSTQPASTGLPVNNPTYTTLSSSSNSSSMTYLPYHEPNPSSLTNKPAILPSS